MNRLLPIFLLALGLVLAFSSLATAKSPEIVDFGGDVMCLEDTLEVAEAVPLSQDKRFLRCWKKIQLGLVVAPCPMDPGLADAGPVTVPAIGHELVTDAANSIPIEGIDTLDLPPPKA